MEQLCSVIFHVHFPRMGEDRQMAYLGKNLSKENKFQIAF